MSRSRQRRHTSLVLIAAAAMVTASCVKQEAPTVGIQPLTANIVFGVKQPATPAPLGGAISQDAAANDVVLDTFDISGTKFKFVDTLRTRAPKPECPTAGINAQPNEDAAQNISAPPTAGVYRWKKAGTVKVTTPIPFQYDVKGFTQRIIQNVSPMTADTVQRVNTAPTGDPPPPSKVFTYEMIEPDLVTDGQIIDSTFKVRTDANQATQFAPIQPSTLVSSTTTSSVTTSTTRAGATTTTLPPVPDGTNAGEPDRGITLTSWTFKDKKGTAVGSFNPTPGILLFPLGTQIFPGASFQAGGVDPKTGASLQINGQIIGKKSVDVCGELILGWLVKATENYSAGNGGIPAFTRQYDYVVSNNLGGIIVQETYNATVGTSEYDYDLTLGQVKPAPLPTSGA